MKHNLSDEVINRQAKFAYWAYQKALGNELPTLWDQGDKELTLRAAYPKGYSKDSPILTDAERAPWIAVANRLADSLVGMPIEPGSTATLFASGDFPATKIELVKMYEVQMGTVKFPDGTLREIPSTALIDWCSEWYKGDLTMHIDNFGERVPHPVTGEPWPTGAIPDMMKAGFMMVELSEAEKAAKAKPAKKQRKAPKKGARKVK